MNALQVNVVGRVAAARRAAHDDVITGLENRRANPLLFEPTWIAPLSAEFAHDAAAVIGGEIHPCMGIAVLEADDVAFERDHLVFVIIARERMVRVCRGYTHQGTQGQKKELALHI